jgi:hypothetical protein
MNGILKSIIIGVSYCLSQRLGESILGFIITDVRGASDVNIDGAILFAIIGFLLSVLPYLLLYPLVRGRAQVKISNSTLSAIINLFVLIYFYVSGLIQKDPTSFIIASLLVSMLFVVAERKFKIGEQRTDEITGR